MGVDQRGKNNRRRRISKNVVLVSSTDTPLPPKEKPVRMPAAPENLNDVAKGHWKFMVKELADRLLPIDAVALALYCETYSQWIDSGQKLKESGAILTHSETKNKYRNPWLDVQKSSRKEMYMYLALFGMSPHDRAKLGIKERPPAKEENEFHEF